MSTKQREREPSVSDERTTLLPDKDKEKDIETAERQMLIEDAAFMLIHLVICFFLTFLASTVFVALREFFPNRFPVWVAFAVLWIGHGVSLCIGLRTIQLVFKSLMPSSNEKAGHKWQRSNEKRISLAQFTLYQLLWASGVSVIILCFEILLYLVLVNAIPPFVCLIPVYIFSVVAVLNSLVCRTTPLSVAICFISLLVFCILCNLKLDALSSELSWAVVSIPVFLIFFTWLVVLVYILFLYFIGIYKLQLYQIEAVALYMVSVFCAIGALGLGIYELQDELSPQNDTLSKILTLIIFTSECFFFAGALKCAIAGVQVVISRMGSDRPQALARSEDGWDVDVFNSFDSYLLLGEVETNRPAIGEDGKLGGVCCGCFVPLCACCQRLSVDILPKPASQEKETDFNS